MSAEAAAPGLAYSWLPRLGGAGVRLRLAPPDLYWGVGLAEGHIALSDISDVRLRFVPARFGSPSYEIELAGRSGARVKVGSISRLSITGVRDQRAEFGAFVRALHAALASAGGRVSFRGGYAPWRFWLMAVMGAVAGAGLVAVFAAALMDRQWNYALFLGVLSAFVMWPTAQMIWRNRPVSYTPQDIPAHLLPA
ncbi:hypothetical protein ACI7BZ_15080 [Xanthobacter sp. AM11]|uniref:hypothetical protein n=1 Tax=Xanthobacter sp. AM11 TaxID=3380643 RepID=UPI0039BFA060